MRFFSPSDAIILGMWINWSVFSLIKDGTFSWITYLPFADLFPLFSSSALWFLELRCTFSYLSSSTQHFCTSAFLATSSLHCWSALHVYGCDLCSLHLFCRLYYSSLAPNMNWGLRRKAKLLVPSHLGTSYRRKVHHRTNLSLCFHSETLPSCHAHSNSRRIQLTVSPHLHAVIFTLLLK